MLSNAESIADLLAFVLFEDHEIIKNRATEGINLN